MTAPPAGGSGDPGSEAPAPRPDAAGGATFLVASGILLSRIAGFVRQRVFAHFFGATDAADAFSVAFRIPNLLQNLLGEGVLSGSFIPVYASLRAAGEDSERRRVASAVLSLLILMSSLTVLIGILIAPVLVDVISPGFDGAKRDLTINLVRILYPGAALLVWSAWCLGVLNSHGRFFLSYVAPVIWNAAMIVALLVRGPGNDVGTLAVELAWASVIGSGLVLLLQLPSVLSLLGGLQATLGRGSLHVRTVTRNFAPTLLGRGVVQLSAYVDVAIASLIASGAAALLGYAQTLYLLPVSLFGMSVTAAELPAMASGRGSDEELRRHVRTRLSAGLARIAFFVVPSAIAFLALGDVLAAILFRGGRFGAGETVWVWRALGGAALGLLAATSGRLYASAFYAMRDARTPVRFALVRVGVSLLLGVSLALAVPRTFNLHPLWGVAGLTLASSVGAVVEFRLLQRALGRRLGDTSDSLRLGSLASAAAAAAAAAWFVRWALGDASSRVLPALLVVAVYGVAYLALTWWMGFREVRAITGRLARLGRRRAG